MKVPFRVQGRSQTIACQLNTTCGIMQGVGHILLLQTWQYMSSEEPHNTYKGSTRRLFFEWLYMYILKIHSRFEFFLLL